VLQVVDRVIWRPGDRGIGWSGDLGIGKSKPGIGWDDSAKSLRSWDGAIG